MSNDLDIAKCLEIAKKLTLQAGEIIKGKIKGETIVQDKGVLDFVTNYDHKVEKLLIDGLSKEFSDHKILAEEMIGATQKMPELTDVPTWILDPIDGTINFIHSFPHSCISIGLTVCKEPVLGVIYNPANSELYTAVKGEGAFLNGKPICTSKVTELRKALLVYEPGIMIRYFKPKDIQFGRIEALTENSQCTRSIGSAALTMAYIARGIVDCFFLDELKPWDVVAGTAILREAGGFVLDTKGGTFDIMNPNTIAASSKILAQTTSKLIIDTDLKMQRKRLKKT